MRWQAQDLLAGGVEAVLATGAEHAAVAPASAGATQIFVLYNPKHEASRSTSVRAAALPAPGFELAIFCNIDQPLDLKLVRTRSRGLARLAGSADNLRPGVVEGRWIHPVLFRSEL